MRPNNRASYIDVTLHQAARRDALALGHTADDQPTEPMSLSEFLLGLCALLSIFVVVLWAIRP